MSVNYNAAQTNTTVIAGLNANGSISGPMNNAISKILNLQNVNTVNVGNFDGTTYTAPPGFSPLVIANIPGAISDSAITVRLPQIIDLASSVVFDSNRSVIVTFGGVTGLSADEDSETTLLSHTLNGVDRVVVSGNGNDVLNFVDNGNTTVDGSAGNDSITTTAGADSITGGTGNDTISAGAGNDTIVSGVGLDTVNGGLGFDIVQVTGTPASWTTSVTGGTVTLTSTASAANAVTATNVNFVSFTTATGSQTSEIFVGNKADGDAMRLYQALLDRSPDAPGAQYWLTQVAGGEGTFKLANAFMASPEYIAAYGTQSNTQYINQIYDNAFNRAPDAGGLAYWTNALNNGASRANVAVAIVGCPEGEIAITNVIFVSGLT